METLGFSHMEVHYCDSSYRYMLAHAIFISGNSTGGNTLTLQNENSTRISIPPLPSQDLTLVGNVAISGQQLVIGSVRQVALSVDSGDITLQVNPGFQFSNGIVFGNATMALRPVGTSGRLGVGVSVAASPTGTIQSAGGTRSSKGTPVLDTDDVGFSFDSDGNTGLFAFGGLCFTTSLSPP